MRSSYFYCGINQDISSFEMYSNDPSISKYIPGLANTNSATNSSNSTTSSSSTRYTSNPIQSGINESLLENDRKNDSAFQHFKQKIKSLTNTSDVPKGEILTPEKCSRVEIDKYFGFVRAWWWDNNKGRSQTGTKPLLLRVIGDDICLCPDCRKGFEKANYTDDLCECNKIHNMIFKCHLK